MRRTGFTLVELLIVMAVIAALISVIAPMGLNALKQARTVQVATDLRGIMTETIGMVAARGQSVTIAAASFPGYKSNSVFTYTDGTGPQYVITVAGNYDYDYLGSAFGANSTYSTTNTAWFTGQALTFSASNYIYN